MGRRQHAGPQAAPRSSPGRLEARRRRSPDFSPEVIGPANGTKKNAHTSQSQAPGGRLADQRANRSRAPSQVRPRPDNFFVGAKCSESSSGHRAPFSVAGRRTAFLVPLHKSIADILSAAQAATACRSGLGLTIFTQAHNSGDRATLFHTGRRSIKSGRACEGQGPALYQPGSAASAAQVCTAQHSSSSLSTKGQRPALSEPCSTATNRLRSCRWK